MKSIRKARQAVRKEQDRQANMISCACFVTLWKEYGWRTKRIMDRFEYATKVQTELNKTGLTPLELLEQETGIEMMLDGYKSYHEYLYLSNDIPVRAMSDAEIIYMQRRSERFAPLILLSSLCVVLHRTDQWGFDRLSRFLSEVDAIRKQLVENESIYEAYMLKETGQNARQLWGGAS